jgi:hypothetical protein
VNRNLGRRESAESGVSRLRSQVRQKKGTTRGHRSHFCLKTWVTLRPNGGAEDAMEGNDKNAGKIAIYRAPRAR